MRLGVKVFVATALLASSLGAWALDGRLSAEDRAKFMTDKMKGLLGLSEAQVSQVAGINLDNARKFDALRTRHTASRDENDADIRDARKERETQLEGVLDAKQWALYQQKKADLANDMKAWARERHSQTH